MEAGEYEKSDLHVLRQKSISETTAAQTQSTDNTQDEEIQNQATAIQEGESRSKHGEGEAAKGRKVSKKFGRRFYTGQVVSYDPETHWYKVAYDDGDEEEYWWWELSTLLVQPPSASKKRARAEGDQKPKPTRKEQESSDVVTMQEETQKDLQSVYEETDAEPGVLRKRGRHPDANFCSESDGMTLLEDTPADPADIRTLRPRKRSIKEQETGLGLQVLGRETSKNFGGTVCDGRVTGFDPDSKYYKISYDDGDEEELFWSELKPILLPESENASMENEKSILEDSEPEHIHEPQPVGVNTPTKTRDKGELGKAICVYKKEVDTLALLPRKVPHEFHPALLASRCVTTENAENLEYFAWGEVVAFDKVKCPELQAVKILPTLSPIVHLAASQHHLAALTAAGQVFVWRNRHGNIQERTNQWEHISDLDNKSIVLVDIAGFDVNRAAAGYTASQEDQIPDPFHLVAMSYGGRDYVLQGSQPQEPVHTYPLVGESRLLSLEEVLRVNDIHVENIGRIVQVSIGSVTELDEPPFIGYITDSDHVLMRSATRNYVEEVNKITGFTGRPLKVQCGMAYHAILMTDDGCAWTWGLTGSTRTLSVCQPAHSALDGQKVIDVGCFGDGFIALTEDGRVYQWIHGANKFIVSSTVIAAEDRLKKVAIGDGLSSGISSSGKLHTWRTFTGRPSKSPFGREEESKNTTVSALGKRTILKGICVAGSLVVVAKKPKKGRPGKKTMKNAAEEK